MSVCPVYVYHNVQILACLGYRIVSHRGLDSLDYVCVAAEREGSAFLYGTPRSGTDSRIVTRPSDAPVAVESWVNQNPQP